MSFGRNSIASVPKLHECDEELAFASKNFLLLEELQKCVDGTETDANKISQARANSFLLSQTKEIFKR